MVYTITEKHIETNLIIKKEIFNILIVNYIIDDYIYLNLVD